MDKTREGSGHSIVNKKPNEVGDSVVGSEEWALILVNTQLEIVAIKNSHDRIPVTGSNPLSPPLALEVEVAVEMGTWNMSHHTFLSMKEMKAQRDIGLSANLSHAPILQKQYYHIWFYSRTIC